MYDSNCKLSLMLFGNSQDRCIFKKGQLGGGPDSLSSSGELGALCKREELASWSLVNRMVVYRRELVLTVKVWVGMPDARVQCSLQLSSFLTIWILGDSSDS